jgi:trehalose/maltose transport system substrate-binding protein
MKLILSLLGIYIKYLLALIIMVILAACATQPEPTPVEVAAPLFSDPMISAPTPQEPGKEIGVAVDVSNPGGADVTYDWQADGGEIVRGQDSPAITYRTPEEPGVYFVRVTITWGNNSVEKMTPIEVQVPDSPSTEPPDDTPASKPPTPTTVPAETATPVSQADTPEPAAPTDAGPLVYDNFNNPAFDGSFNTELWEKETPWGPSCFIEQTEGTMGFRGDSGSNNPLCVLEAPLAPSDQAGTIEAKIFAEPGSTGHYNIGVIQFVSDLTDETVWFAQCGIFQDPANDWIGAVLNADVSNSEEGANSWYDGGDLAYGEWYTFRLEVHPTTLEVNCYLNDTLFATHIPEATRAETIRSKGIRNEVVGYWTSKTESTYYFDDVRVIATPEPTEPTPQWDALVTADFTSIRRQPDVNANSVISLSEGDGFDISGVNDDQTWVFGSGQGRTGWVPVDRLQVNIDLDTVDIRESNVRATDTAAPTDTPAPAATATPPPVQEIPQDLTGTTLRVFFYAAADEGAAYGQLIEAFTAQTGIQVEVIEAPQSATDNLAAQLQLLQAESSEIDVFAVDVIWPGILAPYAVDLNQYVPTEDINAHFPSAINNNTVNGKLVALPWHADAGMLYYRTDLLEKYGFGGPPQNWDQLFEMATVIQDGERNAGNGDFWGYVWQGNTYEGLTCDALEWQASEGGGHIIEPDGRITVNNPAAITAFERATGWVGTISPPEVTGFQEEDARMMWEDGNAAFMRNWPYAYALGQGSGIAGRFDISALPAGAAGHSAATLGGWSLMVSRYSQNIEAATLFAQFMTNATAQKSRAIDAGYLPTIATLYSDGEITQARPEVARLFDVYNNSVARPSTVTGNSYDDVSYAYYTAIHSIITGERSAAEALAGLEQELVNITGFPTGAP